MDAQGYDESRFIGPVRRELFCIICRDVVNDPRCCQNKEHPFCLACITHYLQNPETQECPACREHLTPETLKHPGRFFMICLSELKIKCDYIDLGCPDHIQLGNLQHHVGNCGFAPVKCEKCDMQINRKDKDNHDKSFCQLGGAKCQDCGNIKASQYEMKAELCQVKAKQGEMKGNQDEMKGNQNAMKRNQDDMKDNQDVMKQQLNEIMNAQEEYQVSINRQLNKRKHDQMEDNVDEIKQAQAEMRTNQMVFETEVRNQFEGMTEMLNQLLQRRNLNNNGAQVLDPPVPANNQDIIILGGKYAPGAEGVSNTVEKFNIVEGKSTQLPKLSHPRANSASCVYNRDVIIAGGFDCQDGTDSIEILKINQDPWRWMLHGKLPVKLSHHDVIVYQSKLYVIGGYNWSERKNSNNIYELSIIPPYTAKLLATMPQPRRFHKVEIVKFKLFILGGTTTGDSKDATDSVVVYTFIKNKFKPYPSLPKPVWGMSTVTWGNMIILIGGRDRNDQVLNEVTMYDTKTGQSQILPPLIHKRFGSSAVIMHDVIVVLGGLNEEGYLNSVESFTMGDDQWEELPGMKEKRHFATAVAKPRN